MKYSVVLISSVLLATGSYYLLSGSPDVIEADKQEKPAREGLTDAERLALQKRIQFTVRERGTLESANPLEIRSRLSKPAVILSVVEDGAHVKKGDVLVRFDSSALKEELKSQQIAVDQAKVALKAAEEMFAQAKKESLAQGDLAGRTLQLAELTKKKFLSEGGEYQLALKTVDAEIAIAESRIRATKARVTNASGVEKLVAEADLVAASKTLEIAKSKKSLLTTFTLKQKTMELENEVAQLKVKSLHGRRKSVELLAIASTRVSEKQSTLLIENSKLKRLQQELQLYVITASRDGVVLHSPARSRRAEEIVVDVGETIPARQRILSMPDFQNLQVRVRLHETAAIRVRRGQKVKIRFDALPDKAVSGTVKYLSRNSVKGEWPNTDITYFESLISIDKIPAGLKIGMNGEVEIDVSIPGK
ncbi:MAG: HlyD family type I secretion periplasmic adaptor subunit [Planctomycetaceae bacterium]